jgi:hypothetical protein
MTTPLAAAGCVTVDVRWRSYGGRPGYPGKPSTTPGDGVSVNRRKTFIVRTAATPSASPRRRLRRHFFLA